MRLVFSRSRTVGSLLIRAACWSPFSHCGIWTEDGTVIEATWPQGVREVGLATFVKHATHWEFVDIDVPNEAAGIAWGRSQIGKPYDVWGVIGLGLRRNWQADDAWWCSEFMEMLVAKAERPRFRRDAHRLTPYHSWIAV